MDTRRIAQEIDRLYQLPLDDFTAARNALAKQAGVESARIRALTKPSIVAWAVNQLYWQRRDLYDSLIEAAEAQRQIHKAVLSGRTGDLRSAGQAHDARLDAAIKGTLAILTASGQPATDATRQAIAVTLRALPVDEAAGHLTKALQPGGFEMLAGLSLGGGPATGRKPAAAPPPVARLKSARPAAAPKVDAAVRAKARAAAATAERAVLQAEHAARRAEFERARAARDAERAAKAASEASEALQRAQDEADKAEEASAAAVLAEQAAERQARAAETAVKAARAHAEQTRRDADALDR